LAQATTEKVKRGIPYEVFDELMLVTAIRNGGIPLHQRLRSDIVPRWPKAARIPLS